MKDEVLSEIVGIRSKISEYEKKYDPRDIRISFLDGIHSILCHYFLHLEMTDNKLFEDSYLKIFQIDSFPIGALKIQKQNWFNSSNSTLIIDSWSNFELFISYLSFHHLPQETREEMTSMDYNALLDCLTNNNVEGGDFECLKKRVISEYHLVNTNLKIRKILSSIKDSYDNKAHLKYTRKFLEHFGRLRNCIHSNYIFHGDSQMEYQFEDSLIQFIPNEPITVEPNSENLIFRFVKRLRKEGEHIIDNIECPELIFDPSHLLIE